MQHRQITVVFAALMILVATSSSAGIEADRGGTADAFARFAGLAGEWRGSNGHGEEVVVTYQIVSGGSAVVERYHVEGKPSGDDMVTVYYRDGDDLMLDHYCIAGNQPRMRAIRITAAATKVAFDLDRITNLGSAGDGHMGRAEFSFDGDDHLTSRWTYFEGGREAFTASIDVIRVARAAAVTSGVPACAAGAR